jgi:hypothetical protein
VQLLPNITIHNDPSGVSQDDAREGRRQIKTHTTKSAKCKKPSQLAFEQREMKAAEDKDIFTTWWAVCMSLNWRYIYARVGNNVWHGGG